MKAVVVIAPLALRQLQEAADWYRDRSQSNDLSRDWLDGFFELLMSLHSDPERHPLARECQHFPDMIREVHYGSGRRITHRALYRIQDTEVHVLTVRHIAQVDVNLEFI